METPFVVLRESVSFVDPGLKMRVPLAQAFEMYRHATWVARAYLSGDQRALEAVERAFRAATTDGPHKPAAVLYAYALWEAYRAERAARDAGVAAEVVEQPEPENGIGDPNDAPDPETVAAVNGAPFDAQQSRAPRAPEQRSVP